MMEQAIDFIPIDTCHICMTPNSIDLYNNYNSPCNFTKKIEQGELTNLKAYGSYMRCKKCGAKFMIDWTRGIPQPQYFTSFYNIFMNTFTEG